MSHSQFMRQCQAIVDRAARSETYSCGCNAEDLRQDVLEKIWRYCPLCLNMTVPQLTSYLKRAVKNAHCDRHRRADGRHAQCLSLDDLPLAVISRCQATLSREPEQEMVVAFHQACKQLSAMDLDALKSELQPKSIDQASVAKQVSISRDVRYQRKSRAQKHLRQLVGLISAG